MSMADPPAYRSPLLAAYPDIDLISLHSAAPSYSSSIPPAYSVDPAPAQPHYRSLIPSTTAGGTPITAPVPPQYVFGSWPTLSNHTQSRAYMNVAARRARRAEEAEEQERIRNALQRAEAAEGSESARQNTDVQRQRRREELDAAMVADARAWDFFQRQVQDWEQRNISWRAFKERHEGRRKKKGRWSLYGRFG